MKPTRSSAMCDIFFNPPSLCVHAYAKIAYNAYLRFSTAKISVSTMCLNFYSEVTLCLVKCMIYITKRFIFIFLNTVEL